MSTFIEQDAILTKPYYLISTLSFNLKAFDFLNLIFTQPPRRGEKPLTISFFILCLFLKTSFLIPHSSFLNPLYRPEICLHFYLLLLTSLKHRPLPLPPLPSPNPDSYRERGKAIDHQFFYFMFILKDLIPHSSFLSLLIPHSSFLNPHSS